jgi:choline dehydrogenase-like flavoprotein
LPLFKRAENSHCFADNEYHGNSGPLHVSYLRSPSPANEAFRAACVEKGIPLNPDYNGASQFGISPAQVTQYNGERWNAARAYLHANADRKNLTVLTGCHARKVIFEGKTATGVELRRDGQVQQIRARKEVILSAGAYGSPQLLMLSGIGPKAHLQQHGIAVLHDLPGVGQNLQDHVNSSLSYRTPRWKDTVGISVRGVWELIKAVFEWRKERKGWVTTPGVESNGFISTCGNPEHPDIQLAFVPVIIDDHTRKTAPGPRLHAAHHAHAAQEPRQRHAAKRRPLPGTRHRPRLFHPSGRHGCCHQGGAHGIRDPRSQGHGALSRQAPAPV